MTNQPAYPQGPYPQQPPPPAKKGMSTCLIVVLVAAVLAVPALGVFAALGIYGVRRYIASSKTAEAKNTIGAISRAAVSAYEREALDEGQATHKLCKPALPVPARVPSARKYVPSSAAGADFNTGAADTGWKCLRFSMTMPMYYQYHYQQGGGWVTPEAAPGADGFEAAAVGDLDGNGVHSRFSRAGRVVGGSVVVSTSLFIDKEFE